MNGCSHIIRTMEFGLLDTKEAMESSLLVSRQMFMVRIANLIIATCRHGIPSIYQENWLVLESNTKMGMESLMFGWAIGRMNKLLGLLEHSTITMDMLALTVLLIKILS